MYFACPVLHNPERRSQQLSVPLSQQNIAEDTPGGSLGGYHWLNDSHIHKLSQMQNDIVDMYCQKIVSWGLTGYVIIYAYIRYSS